MVSPADGMVTKITKAVPPAELEMGDSALTRVSIFLNVFDVHVNRVPRAGRVSRVAYYPGEFLDARASACPVRNEQLWLDLDDAQDEDGAETWSQSSHHSHFLFRAMRCESADMDRAMRLYHHSDIVKALLPGLMGFFPDAARVAIPLREQRPTPHVVVTRDGAFVTCLGEGMGVRNLPVIPYASFVPAMHQADQRIHKNRVRAQQLRELTFVQLADSLIGGPGHLTREQVRVLDRDPTTYTLPVTKTFMVVWETLSRAWILTGRQNQASRQQEIAIQRLAAIARMCTYLMGHIYEPLVLELLSRLAAYETTMEMEFLTALCRHPEGGDRLLDLAASDKSYPRPRTIAPQLLLSHISTHEENAGRVARRFQQLELLFDGWEMVRVFMTSLCNVGPERLQEMGTRKHLASVAGGVP